jgi:hypothetical protein
MNTFKKKSLYAALAGVSALGVTGAAQAVNVNPDGLGQVLIYPYYTVRDKVAGAPFGTLLSVVNSTASAKAVKVRFNEGKNSREVLDFNLFLSKKDVWTAAVLPSGEGAGVGTLDKSCTVPALPAAGALQAFVNYAYLGDPVEDESLDRTREGYIEIIEMGTLEPGSATEIGVTHKAGVPPCTALGDTTVASNIRAPSGGLFGGVTLINVLAGEDFTEDAVALDFFRNTGSGVYDLPGSIKPDLSDVNPPTAVLFSGSNVYQSTPIFNNIDAISALFMHEHIYNEFVLDTGTKSGTDWVLTAPTKRYYYAVLSSGVAVDYLFQRNMGVDGACDDVTITVYDREENTVTPNVSFSPPRPGKPNTLCWEANVLTFNGSQVLGSKNNRSVTVPYQNGWADLFFPVPTSGFDGFFAHYLPMNTTVTSLSGATSSGVATYFGLPIIGFAVQTFNNGTLTNSAGSLVQSQYGGNFVHKGLRRIQ